MWINNWENNNSLKNVTEFNINYYVECELTPKWTKLLEQSNILICKADRIENKISIQMWELMNLLWWNLFNWWPEYLVDWNININGENYNINDNIVCKLNSAWMDLLIQSNIYISDSDTDKNNIRIVTQ